MAKSAQAPCPVCGREFDDPEYSTHLARRTVLKCPNCGATLEWQRKWWEKWGVVAAGSAIAMVDGFARDLANHYTQNRFANGFQKFAFDATLIFAVTAVFSAAARSLGLFQPNLMQSRRSYVSPMPYSAWLKEQREHGTLPQLQVNRRHILPSFLRGQSVLPLEEPRDWTRIRR